MARGRARLKVAVGAIWQGLRRVHPKSSERGSRLCELLRLRKETKGSKVNRERAYTAAKEADTAPQLVQNTNTVHSGNDSRYKWKTVNAHRDNLFRIVTKSKHRTEVQDYNDIRRSQKIIVMPVGPGMDRHRGLLRMCPAGSEFLPNARDISDKKEAILLNREQFGRQVVPASFCCSVWAN